jgi:hypothetical protein
VAGHIKHRRKGRVMQTFLINVGGVFFGTVRRAQWTLSLLALTYFSWRPGDLLVILKGILYGVLLPILGEVVTGVAQTVGGLIGSVITILIVYLGFKIILKKVFAPPPASKKKRAETPCLRQKNLLNPVTNRCPSE